MELLQLLLLALLSYPAAFVINFANVLKLMRDVANNGYAINFERYREMENQLKDTPEANKLLLGKLPIINIFFEMKRTLFYNANRDEVLTALQVLDCLEPLTKEEIDEYNKNQSGFNAFKIMIMKSVKEEQLKDLEKTKERVKDKIALDYDYDFKTNTVKLDLKDPVTGEDYFKAHPDAQERLDEFLSQQHQIREEKPRSLSRRKKQKRIH